MEEPTTRSRLDARVLLLVSLLAGCIEEQALDSGSAATRAEVSGAARANLARVAAALDERQLGAYRLAGSAEDRFLDALELAYRAGSSQHEARVQALAGMAFLGEEGPPPLGSRTPPFRGLDLRQLENVFALHRLVLREHVARNGSAVGVRPLSVCESRYIADELVRAGRPYESFEAYAAGYDEHSRSCPEADRASWYAFRGLGRLGPLWGEPNVMENVEETLLERCREPSPGSAADCADWAADRLRFRTARSDEIAARFLFFAGDQEAALADFRQPIVLVGDRDGDGVADFMRPGAARRTDGSAVLLQVEPTGDYTGRLVAVETDGQGGVPVAPEVLFAEQDVDPSFGAGLGTLGTAACREEIPSADACPLLARVDVLLRRHAVYDETYRAVAPGEPTLFRRASPLVACSMDPASAQGFAVGREARPDQTGFLAVMRVPFRDILTCRRAGGGTVDDPATATTPIQDLSGAGDVDLDSLWLDFSCISDRRYRNEREIAKVGPVDASHVEGLIVLDLAEGSTCPPRWRDDGACDLCLGDDPDCALEGAAEQPSRPGSDGDAAPEAPAGGACDCDATWGCDGCWCEPASECEPDDPCAAGICVDGDGWCDEEHACCAGDSDCRDGTDGGASCDCDTTWGCDGCWCEPASECEPDDPCAVGICVDGDGWCDEDQACCAHDPDCDRR